MGLARKLLLVAALATLISIGYLHLAAQQIANTSRGGLVVEIKPEVAMSIEPRGQLPGLGSGLLNIHLKVRLNRNATATLSFEEPLRKRTDQQAPSLQIDLLGGSKPSGAVVSAASNSATIRESGQYTFSLGMPHEAFKSGARTIFIVLKASDESFYVRKQLSGLEK